MATMNFTMYEGDTHTIRATVRTPQGVAVDITGVTVRWWLAKNAKVLPEEVLIEKETGAGIVLSNPAVGELEITLDPEDTENLGGKTYYHEAEIDDGGVISTVLVGQGTITRTLIPS